MKKLSTDEFEQLPIKGKGRSGHVFSSLINLKPGEALLIEKKDWTRKAGPSSLVRYIEKHHNMKFHFGALSGNTGWAVKRIDNTDEEARETPGEREQKRELSKRDQEKEELRPELVIYYLGRMAFHKIERIEESMKACVSHFWKKESGLVQETFTEMITILSEQGHIVIENEKTYIPLRRV